jgi:endonuclease YncB( thermonuclease family)
MACSLCVPLLCTTLYIMDADTIRCDQETIRLMDFDAPETYRAKCEREAAMGYEAKARLGELLRGSDLTIRRHRIDKYGRRLGRLYVDGVAVADVMTRELLARPYHGGRREPWC